NSVHTYDIEQALNENAYTKTGYKFSGWATTADGSVAYNDKEVVKNLATGGVFELFAVWTANTYQVEFNSNGGIGEMANQTFTYDVEQALSKNAYTRSGYEFSGWATTAGGQKVYDDEDIVGNLATEQDDVVELFAVWTASTYNVTFDSNGGSDCEAITVTYDAPYGELPTPTKDGYTFAGWGQEQDVTIKASVNTTLVDSIMTSTYSASSGTHEVFFSIATSIIAGETYCITYDAKVDSDGWSYQFYNMNGSTSSDSFNLINGRNVVIVTPQANRDYFTWDNVASDYENPFEISNVQVFRMVNQDTIVTTASDHTLIAQWTLDTHTITLDYQGGVDQFLYNDEGSQISGTFEFANDANRVEPADAYKFNGDYVLQGTAGEELTLNIGNTVGKYMVSFYVLAEKETTLNIYLEETNNFEIEEESVELLPNIWTYVGVEYEIISGYGNVNLILGTNNEITIYVDDIKVRRTDTYNIDYDYNYTIESEAIKLPYLVKPGYTFLGWKVVGEDGNVVGDILTTHASGQFGNVTYRAIYKVSNITATIESSDLSPIYGGSDTTITATTYSEGVDVDVTYYWYRNGIK
ncbi:MAG: InlB B-repeat-containing protein, partial [Clostridia bacterium]|nr:InlB B-repeat-containing protein [Clostridia bacterium]